ncbi:hypothetical protein FOL47_010160 [Perkinsus chesapeaki]|uniref:PPPDE domain-containing protein n=1 Tax=Perkinsus chesapeaki TaxID=330153 RepID=A0A7J6L4M5_PERCH|nr:hypothetical protein FOL47_010160 [Perkinsus chesapeaki]
MSSGHFPSPPSTSPIPSATSAVEDYAARAEEASRVATEGAIVEQQAMVHDRANRIQNAITCYVQASNRLAEAASLLPSAHPDVGAISQHRMEVDSRVTYLRSMMDAGMLQPGLPLEHHIKPVSLTMTSSALDIAGRGHPIGGPSSTEVGAAAALGGLGGMLLLGPLGLVAGAAGAAYCTTRTDAVGYAARGAGSATAATVQQGSEFCQRYGLGQRAQTIVSGAAVRAREINDSYHVTENIQAGAVAAGRRLSEFNQQYQVTDRVGAGLARGMSAIGGWLSGNPQEAGPSVSEAARLVWDFDRFWFPAESNEPQSFWFAMHSHLPKFDEPKREAQRYFPAVVPLIFSLLTDPTKMWALPVWVRLRLAIMCDQTIRNMSLPPEQAFLKTLVDRVTLRLAQTVALNQPDNGAIMATHGLYRALFLTLIFRHNGLAKMSLRLLKPLPEDNETVGKFTECTKAVLCNRYIDYALSDDCNPDLASTSVGEAPKDRHVLDELCRKDPEFLVDSPALSEQDMALMNRLKDFFTTYYPNNTVPKVLVLSLSGGVDSMTHLFLLSKLQQFLGFKLVACHIRHSNRDDAKQELQWVTYVTALLGVPLYHHHVKLRRPHGSLKTGIDRMNYEKKTRDIRFSMYAKAHKLAWAAAGLPEGSRTQPVVVVGHHMDDVDENRLAELGKGNLLNINGMVMNADGTDDDEIGNVCQVRPLLLSTRKEELIACASRHNIPYMVDSTPKWSRRGWIRGVLDLGFPIEGGARRQFLMDLTLAGQLSDDLDRQVTQASVDLVPHRIIPAGDARFKKQNRVVTDFHFLAIDTSNLFSTKEAPLLMKEISETKDRLLEVVSRIAPAWSPAVEAYKKQVVLSTEDSSTAVSDGSDEEEEGHKCPIQPIRVDQLREESLTVTILLNVMIRLHDKNPTYRQQFFQGKRPSRRSVEHFCTTAETTRKPFVLTAMRKTCPGLYVSSPSYLCLFDKNAELDQASGGNRESLAKVLFNSFNRALAAELAPPPPTAQRRPTSIRPSPVVDGRQVELHVYDLDKVVSHLNAVTRAFSWGAFHVGVEVYGEEWSFGQTTDPQATGLCIIRPKSHEVHVYRESVPMGNTNLSRADSVWRLMVTMRKEWLGGSYHILRRNCIHFAKALCLRLGCEKEFPSWIEALPSRTEGLSQTFDVASAHVRALDDWLRISHGFNSLRSSVTRLIEITPATAAVPVCGLSAATFDLIPQTFVPQYGLLPPAVLTAAIQRGAPPTSPPPRIARLYLMSLESPLPHYDPARHLTIAVEGCAHGDLDRIYEAIGHLEKTKKTPPVDLLICCGDFQAIRTEAELNDLAAPPKHRHMKDFHRYWTGERTAPITTIFVGGNHEAPSHLRELYYGGWAAKGIYYIGHSGVVRCKGVRIGGLSGIYKGYHYELGHYEMAPYDEDTKRSAYHVRKYEMDKLAALSENKEAMQNDPVRVIITHDWPTGITDYGDTDTLLRVKDRNGTMRQEISRGELGNAHSMDLMRRIRPDYWFSGHMHAKYTALVPHEATEDRQASLTRFIALDKCVPRRQGSLGYLQIITIDVETGQLWARSLEGKGNDNEAEAVFGKRSRIPLQFDLEWLALLAVNNSSMPLTRDRWTGAIKRPTEEDIERVRSALEGNDDITKAGTEYEIPDRFVSSDSDKPGSHRQRQWLMDILETEDVLGAAEAAGPPVPTGGFEITGGTLGADGRLNAHGLETSEMCTDSGVVFFDDSAPTSSGIDSSPEAKRPRTEEGLRPCEEDIDLGDLD